MTAIIEARGLTKNYGDTQALRGVDLEIPGRAASSGLIGPNGSGKTTAIKSILGLTSFDGELKVLGRDPRTERDAAHERGVLHRRRGRAAALDEGFPGRSTSSPACTRASIASAPKNSSRRPTSSMDSRVRQLSKGMVTQLHLALILAIDAKLLVLDEPTLGLDLLFRRSFYDNLLNDYFNKERTILVTTHQVEEIENILTDVLFIEHGKIVLDAPMETLGERFVQLIPSPANVDKARALKPFWEREIFGRVAMLFDGRNSERARGAG